MEFKEFFENLKDFDWEDDYTELTFPDCPTCVNMDDDGKCRFSSKCIVRVSHGERLGSPTHLNVISVVDEDTMKYI